MLGTHVCKQEACTYRSHVRPIGHTALLPDVAMLIAENEVHTTANKHRKLSGRQLIRVQMANLSRCPFDTASHRKNCLNQNRPNKGNQEMLDHLEWLNQRRWSGASS